MISIKLKKQNLIHAGLVSTALSLVLMGCTVVQGKSTPGQYTDDAAVTAQIKAKMLQSDALSAANIHVETQNHVIQMSGFASNLSQINEANRIARSVCSSCQIINDITYSPKTLKPASRRSR